MGWSQATLSHVTTSLSHFIVSLSLSLSHLAILSLPILAMKALAKLHKNISLPQQQAGAAGRVRGGRPEAFLGQWAGVGNVRVQQLQHLGVEGSEAKRRKSSSGRKMAPASAEGPSPGQGHPLALTRDQS